MPDLVFGKTAGAKLTDFAASGTGPRSRIALPQGRVMSDGYRAIFITGIGFWGSARGRAERGRAYVGPFYTRELGLPIEARAGSRGIQPIVNPGLTDGTSAELRLDFAPMFYAWTSPGKTFDGVNVNRPGDMPGVLRYEQAPEAPAIRSLVPRADGHAVTVTFAFAGQDNGGTGITGYRIQHSTDETFRVGVTTTQTNTGVVEVKGLSAGTRYFFKVTARNRVTDIAGKTGGAWSKILTVVTPDVGVVGKILRNGSFVDSDARVWDDSGKVWRPADGRIWIDGEWQPLRG